VHSRVLGKQGQVLLSNPLHSQNCYNDIQTAFTEQVTTTAQNNAVANANAVVMWTFGAYSATNVPPCDCYTFVDTTINTQLRQGNWDWATAAQHWYGIGGTTDGAGGSPVTIPNSFYLTSKP
jgi:hypothetical protein